MSARIGNWPLSFGVRGTRTIQVSKKVTEKKVTEKKLPISSFSFWREVTIDRRAAKI
jgi:hypothetical protein